MLLLCQTVPPKTDTVGSWCLVIIAVAITFYHFLSKRTKAKLAQFYLFKYCLNTATTA
jgi:hypothetical protein